MPTKVTLLAGERAAVGGSRPAPFVHRPAADQRGIAAAWPEHGRLDRPVKLVGVLPPLPSETVTVTLYGLPEDAPGADRAGDQAGAGADGQTGGQACGKVAQRVPIQIVRHDLQADHLAFGAGLVGRLGDRGRIVASRPGGESPGRPGDGGIPVADRHVPLVLRALRQARPVHGGRAAGRHGLGRADLRVSARPRHVVAQGELAAGVRFIRARAAVAARCEGPDLDQVVGRLELHEPHPAIAAVRARSGSRTATRRWCLRWRCLNPSTAPRIQVPTQHQEQVRVVSSARCRPRTLH